MIEDDGEELEDEEEPESLKRKWDREKENPSAGRVCPHCENPLPQDSFFCLFCGERAFENSGPLGRLALWIRGRGLTLMLLVLFLALSWLLLF